MPLQLNVDGYGLRPSFVRALERKGITKLYPWQAAALDESPKGENRNYVYTAPTRYGLCI